MIGEIIVYDADDTYSYPRFKIGDGIHNVNELPFSAQPDWNAAEGAPGHVLNRTHWVDITEEVFLPEIAVTFAWQYKYATLPEEITSEANPKYTPVTGNKYAVEFDGERYECEGLKHTGFGGTIYYYLGNLALNFTGATNTGVPFLYFVAMESSVSVHLIRDNSGDALSTNFAIYEYPEIVHKLPGKFLPDGVPYSEDSRIELLPETSASSFTDPTFGKAWAIHEGTPDLKAGKTYTITYNGTPYDCVCQPAPAGLIPDPNAVAIGNFSVVGGANTGEPFAMLVSNPVLSLYFTLYQSPDFSNISTFSS